jgi:hypothetical protein
MVHVFDKHANFFTMVNTTIVHDEDTARSRIWGSKRHLKNVRHIYYSKNVNVRHVPVRNAKMRVVDWTLNDIVQDNPVERRAYNG